MTHGCDEKPGDLARIMAADVPPEVWARTRHREIHTGHVHKTKKTQTTDTDTYNGIVWRVLPSLAGTDAWHYRNGYVGGRRAAQALVHEYDSGFRALFEVESRCEGQPRTSGSAIAFE